MSGEPNPDVSRITLSYHELLGRRLQIQTGIRLVFAALILVGRYFAEHLVRIEDLPVDELTALGLFVLLYDGASWLLARSHRARDPSPETYRRLVTIMHGLILLDFVALTAGIWLVGGARSPFLSFYLLHVFLAHVILSRRAALTFTGIAYGLLVLLVVGEWSSVLPPHLPQGAVSGSGPLDSRLAITVLVVYGALLGLVSFLMYGIVRQLRQAERRIRLANEELTRLSELRRDFLRTALHNLKSPLGAVTMFLRNLKNGLGGPVTEQQEEWIDRSLARIDGLSDFMSGMQTLATLQAGMIESEAREMDVAAILARVVRENQDLAEAKGQRLVLELDRARPGVVGFERLLQEAVVIYVTNAIRYTGEGGHIAVRTKHLPPVLRVEVEDDGPGISGEDQERLFREFVRLAPPGESAPTQPGSGLGLSIARRIVEAQGGRVGVESEVGGGSTFFMELPAATA